MKFVRTDTPAIPVPASTVVVVRDPSRGAGLDVFLVKRHARSGFMANAYVFPGGRLDEGDRPPDQAACDGVDRLYARLPGLARDEAVRYGVAAVREIFEECGVLLAHGSDETLIAARSEEEQQRLDEMRRALNTAERTLWDIVAERGWRLALDVLVPFAHWVTPEVEPRRFDTRFFLARVPPGQEPSHDERETVDGVWMSPAQALDRCRRGKIILPPPTWRTLDDLSAHASVEEALAWGASQPQIRRQPRYVEKDGVAMLVLPGDPEYPVGPDEAMDRETRFVLDGEVWRARRPPDK